MTDLQKKQYIIYTLGFGTNIMYLLLIGILVSFDTSIQANPQNTLIILGIGVVISVLATYRYIRMNDINDIDISDLVTKLAIYHLPSLISLFAAIVYMYILS